MVVIWLYNKGEALFGLHSIPDNPNGSSPIQVTMHARPTMEELQCTPHAWDTTLTSIIYNRHNCIFENLSRQKVLEEFQNAVLNF